ncbi:MAG: polyprenyl synthetase family protein [Sphingobacteriales bacterium]|nr:MAG: polyprenyl synthetase family protein [Sphingobacteriales bacterium]
MSLAKYQQIVEETLQSTQFPTQPDELYAPVRYIMGLGGKRIRPVLTLLSCDLFGGDLQQVAKPALAMEVFHNFTLVHDDLMDNAPLRRGKQTVHEKWNASTAVLSGDVMLILAYDLLAEIEPSKFPKAIKLFNDTAKKVCEGQQLDMVFEKQHDVSIKNYIEMIGLKTAVLLGGCLQMGALLADASEENQQLIYDFGYTIGVAFQIQDDLLDAYGTSAQFGKTIGGDIAANKKTFLTLKALELADNESKTKLENLYSANPHISNDEKILRVMEIYKKLNIKTQTEKLRDEFYEKAMADLDKIVGADESKKVLLRQFAVDLVSREK